MPDDTPDHIAEALNAALLARYWSEVPRNLRPPESDDDTGAASNPLADPDAFNIWTS